jgi:hypothetical protein
MVIKKPEISRFVVRVFLLLITLWLTNNAAASRNAGIQMTSAAPEITITKRLTHIK